MRLRKVLLLIIATILVIGFITPENIIMPVDGAGRNSYDQESYWFYPWGNSVTHKGVDVFATKGKGIRSSTPGVVIYRGNIERGGNVVMVLGPKWRIHYYAHLDTICAKRFQWVNPEINIGTVGNTGNAMGKPSHLHYSIVSLFPYFWRIDKTKQGWKKMFYLDPVERLNEYFNK